MPGDPWSAVNDLPPMTWRGLEAPPYDMANFSGGFSLAEKRYPFLDGATHDNVGRNPIPMPFRFFFINTLGSGLFPDLFDDWVNAVALDGSSGDLEHPFLGDIRARPKSWDVQLTAQRTAGVVMKVTFIETIDDPSGIVDNIINTNFPVISALAESIDQDYSKLNLPWPDGARTDNLFDLIRRLESLAFSTRLTAEGMINQASGFVNGLIDSVESIQSNKEWALVGKLTAVANSIRDLGDRVGIREERLIGQQSFDFNTSLDEAAAALKNTVGELIVLNPNLLGTPVISKFTVVNYFTEKTRVGS